MGDRRVDAGRDRLAKGLASEARSPYDELRGAHERGHAGRALLEGSDDEPFDAASTPASPDLGIVADTFWRLPGVARSDHPFAFAAAGPKAADVVSGALPIPPHAVGSPVGRVHDLGGQVLLLGVGHEADTTLHLAELVAGVPYRVPKRVTVLRDGRPVRIDYGENDHCCARFALADGWLRERNLQSEGRVGRARARLARAKDVVAVALERLFRDPLLFLHPPDAGCAECDEARRSIGTALPELSTSP